MKTKYKSSILSSLIAVMFILSVFSVAAVAQDPNGKEKSANPGPQMTLNPASFGNAGQLFDNAKAQFENALKQFNTKKDAASKQELILKAQDYLEKAIDRIILQLDVLKSRADLEPEGVIPFNVSNNIDANVAELEQLKIKVQQDNTTDELRADNNELKLDYTKIRLETRYGYELLLNNRIDNFVGKKDNVTARLNAAIQNLNNKSKDTSSLETIAANFTNLMQEAAANQQNTGALLATHNGFDASGIVINNTDAQAFLNQVDSSQKETIRTLKDAARQLQIFVRDYRRLSGGSAVTGGQNNRGGRTQIMGTGTLTANGSGRAVIEGNVTVTLSGINSTLLASRNSAVTIDGGTNQTLGNGQVQYQGFNSATITGDNIRIAISGNNINLTAAGTGIAVLDGNGIYSVENNFSVNGQWKKGG
jgi:hypothetical protein